MSTVLRLGPERGLNFLVVGDWGRQGKYYQDEVAEQMAEAARLMNSDFVISTGDNFYRNGVQSVSDLLWNRTFENIYHHKSLMKPWYVVLGNHDYRGNPQAQVNYTDLSSRWYLPKRYYSITQQVDVSTQALFVFLDTSPFMKEYHGSFKYGAVADQDTAAQRRWLDNTLAESQAEWKVVVGHHQIYSGGFYGNNHDLIARIAPILKKHRVHAYFNGHEHDLQHLKGAAPTHYFVSGAGSKLRGTGSSSMTQFSESVAGFMAVSIISARMRVYCIDYKGNVVYMTVVDKNTTDDLQEDS
ncbi:acid phosphatase [candidate division KSB1 bacterium]|nr:acid phosphatase [candidate division KSB1 bacterium]NIR69418.1 acid phosphatase [candidate division KSB1 bacterium]NIS24216.1 acid phosphatase [candidate division KSB1 bacterium]NIT71130.1 acid phosphatase [candidate division KSB1 bacterium]NIU24835.1 acid phosphatase [candidate division KSB1 bacterium]